MNYPVRLRRASEGTLEAKHCLEARMVVPRSISSVDADISGICRGLAASLRMPLRSSVQLRAPGINVSRVCSVRQGRELVRKGGGASPFARRLALPESGVEAGIAKGGAALETGQADMALDRRKLERQSGNWTQQACQRPCLEPLDVELDEGGQAMAIDQRIERGDRDLDRPLPGFAFSTSGATAGGNEIRRDCWCGVATISRFS
jgi:hypothetical protein